MIQATPCSLHPHQPRRSTATRRLPAWLRRGLRACARLARRWAGPPMRATWVTFEPTRGALYADEAGGADERRCGWFDSSQDLREGLCVSEHAAADPVTAQLPVMAWVELQLSGWRPALAEAQPALAG